MRRLALIALTLAILLVPGSATARPRLDHGYWTRTSGPWADVEHFVTLPGGAAAVLGADGAVARITGGGRPDRSFGDDGVAHPWENPGASDVQMLRWGDRIVVARTSYEYWQVSQEAIAIDRRGATSVVGENRQFPGGHPPFTIAHAAVLVPFPDGTLWNVVHSEVRPAMGSSWPSSDTDTLTVLPPGGTLGKGVATAIDPPVGEQATRVPPVPSGAGLIVTVPDTASGRISLLRITRAGATDPGFARVWLLPGETITDLLSWDQGGAIAFTRAGRVLWIDGRGQVLHQRAIPPRSTIRLDAARRLLVLHRRANGSAPILRRLRADATTDTAFGSLVLRAAGRYVTPVGVVPQPGGRILAVGRASGDRTVAWGVRSGP